MDEVKLDVLIRERSGKQSVKAVRREGFIPAVVYGGEKKEPTTIKVNRANYEKIKRDHHGQSLVFHLNVLDGEKKLRDYSAIVKEEQFEPVSEGLIHVDFKRISLKEEIEVKVTVKLTGEPVGVKEDGGSLDHGIWELDVVCLPTNIPEALEVDVSTLHIGDGIHVKDIKLPAGVKTNHDPDSMVASVVAPMEEVEEAAEESEEEPEVIGEKERQERRDTKDAEQAEESEESAKSEKDDSDKAE